MDQENIIGKLRHTKIEIHLSLTMYFTLHIITLIINAAFVGDNQLITRIIKNEEEEYAKSNACKTRHD